MKDCQGRVAERVLDQNLPVGPKRTEGAHTSGWTRRTGFPGIWWMRRAAEHGNAEMASDGKSSLEHTCNVIS